MRCRKNASRFAWCVQEAPALDSAYSRPLRERHSRARDSSRSGRVLKGWTRSSLTLQKADCCLDCVRTGCSGGRGGGCWGRTWSVGGGSVAYRALFGRIERGDRQKLATGSENEDSRMLAAFELTSRPGSEVLASACAILLWMKDSRRRWDRNYRPIYWSMVSAIYLLCDVWVLGFWHSRVVMNVSASCW